MRIDIKQSLIDRYYRIIVDDDSADWTFVCPPDYKGITDRKRRITAFYNDGITAISKVLSDIGYYSDIKIPKRYRRRHDVCAGTPKAAHRRAAAQSAMRHFEVLGDDSTYTPY